MADNEPTSHRVINQLTKLKAIEPGTYSGELNLLDSWFYSVEMYFRALDLDYEDEDSEKCAIILGALLRGVALNFHKRLYRTSKLPDGYVELKAVLVKQFGVLDEQKRARDILVNLK